MVLSKGHRLWHHHGELQSSGFGPQSGRWRNNTVSKDQTLCNGLTVIHLKRDCCAAQTSKVLIYCEEELSMNWTVFQGAWERKWVVRRLPGDGRFKGRRSRLSWSILQPGNSGAAWKFGVVTQRTSVLHRLCLPSWRAGPPAPTCLSIFPIFSTPLVHLIRESFLKLVHKLVN